MVVAAKKALETGDVKLILPFAPKQAEIEIKRAFERTVQVRKQGKQAQDLADYWFFETVVRLHREGEGAPYTGLKPAGLDWGPLIPRAEKAMAKGDPKEVVDFMAQAVEEELEKRFHRAMELKEHANESVDAARAYTSAMLGFELYSHHLYANIAGGGEHGEEGHGKGGGEHEH